MGTYIARVHEDFAKDIVNAKKELEIKANIKGASDTQATQLLSAVLKSIKYELKVESKVIKNKIIIKITKNHLAPTQFL